MANFHDLDIKLLVCDFGGVLRDSSAGLDHGYALGFQTEGIPYRYDHQHTWHLRGVGKYDIAIECVKALLALAIRSEEHRLQHILDRADAECVLDEIVGDTLDLRAQAVAERIRLTYKMFFNSPEAATWVNLYPNVREDIQRIAAKGHQIALLTNGNRMTVTRDLPFSEYFDLIISEDEMTAKKPAGDGLTLIMKELNMSPAQTAFACDSAVDIRAAKAALVHSVALLSGMGLPHHLALEHPDVIVSDLGTLADCIPPARLGDSARQSFIPG